MGAGESTWKAVSVPVPGVCRHRSEGMLSARLEQLNHRDLGTEHCRERTSMRWDRMKERVARAQLQSACLT